jgi:FlaA1/EpsC-like NDP-sugar epimerase
MTSDGPMMARRQHGTPTAGRSMAGRTVLITGGTGGIGRATAIGHATYAARISYT